MAYKSRIQLDNAHSIGLKRQSIRRYFYFGSISGIILLAILLSFLFMRSMQAEYLENVQQLSAAIIHEKKQFIHNAVDRTIYMIEREKERVEKQYAKSKLTKPQITKIAEDEVGKLIRGIRLADDGYIWVNQIVDYEGGDKYAIRKIHPNMPDTEGMWLSTEAHDIQGNHPYLAELNGIKKNGELFFDYYFKKMNSDQIAHKMSFAKLYKPWNWVVATGVYLDDIDALIEKETQNMHKTFQQQIITTFAIALGAILAAIGLAMFLEKQLNRQIANYEHLIDQNIKQLQKSQASLARAQQIARLGHWDLHLDTGELYWSDEVFRIFGLEPGECEPSYDFFLSFVHPDDRQMVRDSVDRAVRDRTPYPVEHRIIRPDGSIHVVSELGDLTLDSKGQPIRYVGVVRDITEQKIAEDEKYLREKMQGAIETAGAVCHELNQPLQIIRANIDLGVIKAGDQGLPAWAKIIEQEIKRMADITAKLQKITTYETRHYMDDVHILDLDKSSEES